MENKDRNEFMRLLWLFANDAGIKISKEQFSIKFERLKRFSIEQISRASDHLLDYREKTYPAIPSISEFIKTIQSFETPQISIDDQAEMQAAIVLKKLKYDGRNGTNDFEDSITKSIMTDRWPYNSWAANVLEKDIQWWQKQFVTLYKSYDNHEKADLLIEAPGKKMIPVSNMKSLVNFGMDR